MKRLLRATMFLMLLIAPAAVEAATLTATWNANPAGENVSNYRIWFGPSDGGTACNYPGTNFIDVGNVTSAFVNVAPATYFFAVQAQNGGGFGPCSTAVPITIDIGAASITTQPANFTVLLGGVATFAVVAAGVPLPTLQWQESVGGGPFTDLANGGIYSGVTSSTLTLTGVTGPMAGNQYRVIATNTTVSGTNHANSTAATLTVNVPPAITTQPTDRTVLTGANTSFTVAASGFPAPTFQWQVSVGGGAFTNLTNTAPYSGVTTATLSLTNVTTALTGNRYQAIANNIVGPPATSNAATLTVNAVPAITTQPTNQTVLAGANASFTAAASGTPAPTLQWQESTNGGGSFSNLANGGIYSGVTTGTLTLTGVSVQSPARQYRLVATNVAGTANSGAATLTVNVAPVISTQPVNRTVTDGQNTTFTVVASGTPAPTYQWQLSTNGGVSWSSLTNSAPYSNVASATLNLTAVTIPLNGNRYRVVVTNVAGSVTSNGLATLTVNAVPGAPQITAQPTDQTMTVGLNGSFTVGAIGTPLPTYQWQVSVGGGPFTDLSNAAPYSGVTTATLTLTGVPLGLSGNRYHVEVTNSFGTATSSPATLTIHVPPVITAQPTDQLIASGSSASFSVTATGTPAPAYQWQESTGGTFTDLQNVFPYSGVTTPTLGFTNTPASLTGNLYRVVVSNIAVGGTVTSAAATLTVNIAPAITTLPTDLAVVVGNNGSFTAVVSGTPAPTVQWQVSTNGGSSFANLANSAVYGGVTTTTLTLTGVPTSLDGNLYRIVATNNVGVAASIPATLSVHVAAAIAAQPGDQSVVAGQATSFSVSATGNPAPTYQWQISTNGGATWANVQTASAITSTLTIPSATVWLNQAQFRCVVTNNIGTPPVAAPVTSAPATLTVFGAVSVSPSSLQFSASKQAGSSVLSGLTPAQTLVVGFTGQPSSWAATSNVPWLLLTNGDDASPAPFTVEIVNPGNVIGGSTVLTGSITINSSPASNWAAVVSVTLLVTQTLSAVPVGSFDAPAVGTTSLQGSVAFSGWAAADSGIDRVEIWRDVVPGETALPYQGSGPANGKIFVAPAPLVGSARPDIEAQFAGYPQLTRTGWGTLVLTRTLSSLGDGTYTLYAIAYGTTGSTAIVGSTTITTNNASAAQPFGTIDAPVDGATVSGSIAVTGWALTPGASCTIPASGVYMSVDGGQLVPVVYGQPRSDILAAFPGFTNSALAGAAVSLDTTTLANGMHQMSLSVTDSCARQSWIGTRVLMVQNGGSAAAPPAVLSFAPISGVTRWDPVGVSLTGGSSALAPQTSTGVSVVSVNHGQRIELQLSTIPGAAYTGYHIVGEEWRALPLGSSLDGQAGVFAWEPAASFFGNYELAFVVAGTDGVPQVVRVRVVVGPSVRVLLDRTPGDVQQPYELTGWAIDLMAVAGGGVDEVHVWAMPVAGGTPVLVGATSIGTLRADVASRYGSQFAAAGFRFLLDGLPAGTYDLGITVPLTAAGNTGWTPLARVTVN